MPHTLTSIESLGVPADQALRNDNSEMSIDVWKMDLDGNRANSKRVKQADFLGTAGVSPATSAVRHELLCKRSATDALLALGRS
jgi:hypothetical protein